MIEETIRSTLAGLLQELQDLDNTLGKARRPLSDVTAAEGLVALLSLRTKARKSLGELLDAAREAGKPGLFDGDQGEGKGPKGKKR